MVGAVHTENYQIFKKIWWKNEPFNAELIRRFIGNKIVPTKVAQSKGVKNIYIIW